jgi:hypothetical protein
MHMTLERMQALYRARPFQAFTLHLADGGKVAIKSPEFMSFSPSGRMITVNEPDDSVRFVDLLLVTEAHVLSNGNADGRKPKGRR